MNHVPPPDTRLPRSRARVGSGRRMGGPLPVLPGVTLGEAEPRCPLVGGQWCRERPAWDPGDRPPPPRGAAPRRPFHSDLSAGSIGRCTSPPFRREKVSQPIISPAAAGQKYFGCSLIVLSAAPTCLLTLGGRAGFAEQTSSLAVASTVLRL